MKSEFGKQKEVAKYKDKEANFSTWGESDVEMLSSDEEDAGFKNGVCFMAGTSKVPSRNHSSSFDDDTLVNDMPLENIDDAFEALVMELKRKTKAFTKLRKGFRNVNDKTACLKHELREMTIKFHEMKDVANKTDTSYMNLVSENNDALVLISELETKISNLENLLKIQMILINLWLALLCLNVRC